MTIRINKKSIGKLIGDHKYEAVALPASFLINQLAYQGARIVAHKRKHYDMTTALDRKIPVLPWTISIYFGTFLFWAGFQDYIARKDRKLADRFFAADALSKLVCFLIFSAIPTTNVRPEIKGNSVWDQLLRFCYWIDRPDDLFPSIHCCSSWLCFTALRGRKDVPGWVKAFAGIGASAICASTLTTRQHVLADLAAGIALAEACYAVAGRDEVREVYTRFADKVMALLEKKIPDA